MKLLLLIPGLFLVAVLLIALALHLYGASLPERHREEVTLVLDAPRARVWREITAFDRYPAWWGYVRGVREETLADGRRVTWLRQRRGSEMGFLTRESVAGARLVREIHAPDGSPLDGTWTFTLEDAGPGKTRLRLVEDGVVRVAILRGIAIGLFGGFRETLEGFTRALGRRVAQPEEEPSPAPPAGERNP